MCIFPLSNSVVAIEKRKNRQPTNLIADGNHSFVPPTFYALKCGKSTSTSWILLLWILLFVPTFLQAQKTTKLQIIRADALKAVEKQGVKIKKLIGDVALKQKDVFLYCDSAYFYSEENAVDAFGHVHIIQGDSVNIYADSLKYRGDEKKATLFQNVFLSDGKMQLRTNRLDYDLETKLGSYHNGGTLKDGEATLVSKKGYYYNQLGIAHFKDSVVLIHPDYRVLTDTLKYNVSTSTAWFYGPTTITTTDSRIECQSGWYDTQNDKAAFGKNTLMVSQSQRMRADSLYYERKGNFGRALKKFTWTDTTDNITISGTHAEYRKEKQYFIATNRPLLTNLIDGDTLFLCADTLESEIDSVNDVRIFNAWYDARIYKNNLQAVSDSLHFSYIDSAFRLFGEPVIWSDNSQLSGDTIDMLMRNNKIDQINLLDHAFIINQSADVLFDQIKGRNIYGYFKQQELRKMLVEGNGQSIYFGQDEQEAYVGANKAECTNMWIYLKNKKVDRISFLNSPSATFFPMQQVKPEAFRLDDFRWRIAEKPTSKNDLGAITGH